MRLLMTTDTVGGVWVYALSLVEGLSRRGVRTDLVTCGPSPSDAQRSEVATMRGVQLHERPCRLEWEDDPWDEVAAWQAQVAEIATDINPDIVHANCFAAASEHCFAPTVLVAHSCVCTWWQSVRGERAPAAYERYRELASRALHRADRVVAPTRSFAEQFVAEHTPRRGVRIIHNGGATGFAPNAKLPRVIGAGRLWDEAKNAAVLARAAPQIAASVALAGEAAPDAAHAGIDCLGAIDRQQMKEALATSAIFVHPARYEPFGLAVLEAARSGCALVLGDIPTLRELWHGVAEFVAPDDPDQIAAVTNRLLADATSCRALGARARERSLAHSTTAMARRYRSLYAGMLSRPRGRLGRTSKAGA